MGEGSVAGTPGSPERVACILEWNEHSVDSGRLQAAASGPMEFKTALRPALFHTRPMRAFGTHPFTCIEPERGKKNVVARTVP